MDWNLCILRQIRLFSNCMRNCKFHAVFFSWCSCCCLPGLDNTFTFRNHAWFWFGGFSCGVVDKGFRFCESDGFEASLLTVKPVCDSQSLQTPAIAATTQGSPSGGVARNCFRGSSSSPALSTWKILHAIAESLCFFLRSGQTMSAFSSSFCSHHVLCHFTGKCSCFSLDTCISASQCSSVYNGNNPPKFC